MSKRISAKKAIITLISSAAVVSVVMLNAAFDFTNTSAVYAAASDSQKQIHALENKLSGLKTDTSALKKEIAAANQNAANLEAQITSLERETTLLTSQIKTLETLIAQLQTLSEQQQARIDELKEDEKREQKIFDNMLRMSYEYGSDTYFNLIFGSESIGDFLSRADLITYHLKYNNNVLQNLSQTKASIEKTLAEQQASESDSRLYKDELIALEKELEEKIAVAEAKKAQYEADAANKQSVYEKKLAEFNAISKEIKELYEAQRRNNTAESNKAYSGTFCYPLPSSHTRVSSGFVQRISPISGKSENHNGLDLPAPRGTEIYAADAGKVVIARYSSSWGNYVTIDHGGGVMTLYAHANALNVTVGQTVKRGDVIAYVGSTGWSTGNHLHFTVYKNGVAVNPAPYIGL